MNELQRETERFRRAFAERQPPADLSACPPADRIFSAASGELDPAELEPLLDHVSACAECTGSWRLARELLDDRPDSAVVVPAAARFRRPAGIAGLAAAAALVLAVGVNWNAGPPVPEAPVYRGPERPAAIENRTAAELPASAVTLRWRSDTAWPSYSVQLMDDSLDTLWSAQDISATEVAVPDEVLSTLPAGVLLLWQVQAFQAGALRETSDLFELQITPD